MWAWLLFVWRLQDSPTMIYLPPSIINSKNLFVRTVTNETSYANYVEPTIESRA